MRDKEPYAMGILPATGELDAFFAMDEMYNARPIHHLFRVTIGEVIPERHTVTQIRRSSDDPYRFLYTYLDDYGTRRGAQAKSTVEFQAMGLPERDSVRLRVFNGILHSAYSSDLARERKFQTEYGLDIPNNEEIAVFKRIFSACWNSHTKEIK
jgi:hypothetical protein